MSRGEHWTPGSWRERLAPQQPAYADPAAAERALAQIAAGGPLVTVEECVALRQAVARAARGEAFLLQAGDCAESLANDPGEAAAALASLLSDLARACGRPAIQIGRIAGQFAKPRSAELERRGDRSLPVYRGDAVNGLAFAAAARAHDPARLVEAVRHARTTTRWLRATGAPLFTSHEALLLGLEEALCFQSPDGRWWAGSGHLPWVGERTRDPAGAHVHFASGIANCVAVKCGPGLDPAGMIALAERLDPEREPGRLIFVARLGADAIADRLPALLAAAREAALAAAWVVDPMHGNSRRVDGRKQRRLADILTETRAFFAICREAGTVPAGLHLEVTTGDRAECVGADGIDPGADFPCDPRLTRAEALAVVEASQC